MNTLTINTSDKEDAIKQINAFRLENKNRWYQIELNYDTHVYKMKIYNTWVQIFRKVKDGNILWNDSSAMDIKVGEFKKYLQEKIG